MADVTMPRLSDTMQEGTIATWIKKPGDTVKKGDVLAQIETDKATMDLTAFEAGVLEEVVATEGATVPIGNVVARIGSGSGAAPASPPASREQGAAPASPPATEATGAAVPKTPEARENVAEAPDPDASQPLQAAAQAPAPAPREVQPARQAPDGQDFNVDGKVRASPLARRIAEEHGLDLTQVHGSGPEGRVIRVDVEAVLAGHGGAPVAPSAAVAALAQEDERVPLSQMRRTIARRMTESVTTVPHFALSASMDVTDLMDLRERLQRSHAAFDEDAPRITTNDLIVRAVAVALRRFPDMNVSFDSDALICHGHVNVGVAVATDRGLIVPVIRDADQKTVATLARETRDLAKKARDGKLQPAEYTGGTFSVSNLGMFGVEQFNAIINPPEAGILAVGAVTRTPVEYQGEIALRHRVTLTLSVDHRALDGAGGARFLQVVKKLLENSLLLLE